MVSCSAVFDLAMKHQDKQNSEQGSNDSFLYVTLHCSSDCQHFEMPEPDFVFVEELKMDLEQYESMWSLFEEFNTGLQELSKEDWISFR